MYKVYILENPEGKLYKGFTSDLEQRLSYHNEGKSKYTRGKGPWDLVFYTSFESKTAALQFEKSLKKQKTEYLRWLIASERNELEEGRSG